MSIPFSERPTCTIDEACQASGIGRTKIYEALGDGRLESVKIDARRLIVVPSLLKMLSPKQLEADRDTEQGRACQKIG